MSIIRLQPKSVYLLTQLVEVVRVAQLFQSGRIVGQLDKLFGVLRLQHTGVHDSFETERFLWIQVRIVGIKIVGDR
jgi:hypothetical protein